MDKLIQATRQTFRIDLQAHYAMVSKQQLGVTTSELKHRTLKHGSFYKVNT